MREEMADIEATDPDDYVVVDADGAVKGEVDGKKSAAEESGRTATPTPRITCRRGRCAPPPWISP